MSVETRRTTYRQPLCSQSVNPEVPEAGGVYGKSTPRLISPRSNMGDSGGVVNSLTFARHRLSPLAAFTSGAYFLHNFYTPTLKAYLEARSHNVSGNKQ